MKRFAGSFGAAILLAALFAPTAALADVESGIASWENGDYAAAVKEWRPLASKGDADAQFNLAQAYRLGRGVPADLIAAESWYAKAAVQGHPGAEDNYGLALFQNGKRTEAMPWIKRSAARGDPRAQYVLGTAHFNGDYASKDWVRAYALMIRSSASGFPNAAPALARMDQDIPVAQRQRGTALARDLETQAMRPQIAPAGSQPIRVAEVPPSRPAPAAVSAAPGTSYPEPGKPVPPVKASAVTPAPAKPAPAKIAAVTPAAIKPAAPKPVPAGDWRIQLGAFGNPDNATALWSSLERNVKGLPALQPYLVKSADGKITRLQAGPFANKADAEKQCGLIRSAAQPCLTLKP